MSGVEVIADVGGTRGLLSNSGSLAMLAAIISALPSMRCSPLVPGLQPQTKARIVDAHVPVRPALNSFGHDLGDLLRLRGGAGPRSSEAVVVDCYVAVTD